MNSELQQRAIQIARDIEACANAWEPGAKLLGNVTADQIHELYLLILEMDRMISIDEIRPLVADLRTNAEIGQHFLRNEPWLNEAQADAKAVERLRELVREG